VVAVDTSGSVGDRELRIMGGAMSGIFEQAMPETVYVMDCDARVHSVREMDRPTDIEAVEMIRSVEGGGGTKFQPVFDKIAELGIEPNVVVYLTDGRGDQPRDPGYPVVWAIIPGGQNSIPWGDVVPLEI
jgi:predicted metal-dependent peptidase